jgi:mannose/fructose-specific phosphotransferase system component IIA
VPELSSLSNDGRSVADLAAAIKEWLQETLHRFPEGQLLLVDDRRGSCCQAAQLACRGFAGVTILSGVNLALLLSYASNRDSLPLPALTRKLVASGKAAVDSVLLSPEGSQGLDDNPPASRG